MSAHFHIITVKYTGNFFNGLLAHKLMWSYIFLLLHLQALKTSSSLSVLYLNDWDAIVSAEHHADSSSPLLYSFRNLCIMHVLQRMTSVMVCSPLVLDDLFVTVPWHRVLISSPYLVFSPSVPLCMSLLQWLSISLVIAFQSVLHKLNILSASASPTTSARSHMHSPSLHPCIFLSFVHWLLSHSHVHRSIMKGCYVSAHRRKKLFLSYNGLSHTFFQSQWLSWHGVFHIQTVGICMLAPWENCHPDRLKSGH